MTAKLGPSGKNASELFGSDRMWGLKQISEPDPVSFVPQTIGWIGVLMIVLCLLLWAAWLGYRYRQARAYRRDAVDKLGQIVEKNGNLREIPAILRFVAITSSIREDVAGLRSADFRDWLNRQIRKPIFTDAEIVLLDQIAYLPEEKLLDRKKDIPDLVHKCVTWVKEHHVST